MLLSMSLLSERLTNELTRADETLETMNSESSRVR